MSERSEHSAIVDGLRAGTNEGLAAFYDLYADKLYDFARRQLRDASLAADVVHDTVLIVKSRIGQLRDESKFRAWVYAIVRNEIRAKARARSRHVREEFAPEQSVDPDFAGDHDRRELASLIDEAVAGLTDREREVFHLFARQGLSNEEIAASLELSHANAQKLVQRVRDRIARSAGALLVARQGKKDCKDLAVLLIDWDGTFSPLWRKRIARHVDECATCESRRALLLQPGGAVMAAPFLAAPASLRSRVFDSIANGVQVDLSRVRRFHLPNRRSILAGIACVGVVVVIGVVANVASEHPRLVEVPETTALVDSTASAPATTSVSATTVLTDSTASAIAPATVESMTPSSPTINPSPTIKPSSRPVASSTTATSTVETSTPGTQTAGSVAETTTSVVESTVAAAPAKAVDTTSVSASTTTNSVSNSPSKIAFNSCLRFGDPQQKKFTYSVKIIDPQGVASARMQLSGATTWHAAGSFGNGIWFTVIDKLDTGATKATVVIDATDKLGGVTTAQIPVYASSCP